MAVPWNLQASAGATGGSVLWRGTWSSALSYNPYDGVYGGNGSSYISKTNNTNKDPISNPSDWDLMASSGIQGPKGDTGGSTSVFEYMFSANITEPPTGSEVRLNNVNQNLATKAWIKDITATGIDASNVLIFAKNQQELYIQEKDNATNYKHYRITGNPVDKGTYTELPITYLDGSGTVPEQRVLVGLVHTGPQGPQGPAGAAATIAVGTTTTGAPGTNANVANSGSSSAAVFNFTIPRGDVGAQGIQGIQGIQGPTGTAATATAGTTATGAPGTNANVVNAGTTAAAVFNFTVPRGDVGAQGATGAQGIQGNTGAQGATGPPNVLTVQSTTTGAPGTNASVVISGTSPSQALAFTVPRGDIGPQGPALPIGSIVDFGGDTAPAGWVLAFGQIISRTTYALLFGVYGTKYGVGDGSSTFGLPDLRGYVVAGKDDMGGTSRNVLSVVKTCNNTTAATITVTVGNTDDICIGDLVIGTNIPAGCKIVTIPTATTFTVSPVPTGSNTGVSLRIGLINSLVIGAIGGISVQKLVIDQMPSHFHATNVLKNVAGTICAAGGLGTFGNVNTTTVGGDNAHPNLQPTFILNKIIYAGV